MKVLMLVTFPEFGGTETHVLYLAKALRKYGVQVGIATCDGPFVPYFRQDEIPVHFVSKPDGSSVSETVDDVVDVIADHEYDVVHAHDYESFHMLSSLRDQLPHISIVMTVHSLFYSKQLLYRAGSVADRVIAVSPVVKRRVIQSGVNQHKILWIPNGIDVQKYCPTSSATANRRAKLRKHRKILLYCGRFQSDKWQVAKKLILAAEQVARRDTKLITVLVGFGTYRAAISRLAKQTNARLGRTAIYVLPPSAHMEKYFRSATLVVGTGRVALEAMSCGKPVIAAGSVGYMGIVSPKTLNRSIANNFGDHGAPEEVRVQRLSNDINLLLKNPRFATSLGRNGRRIAVERFSIHKMAMETYRVYSNV